MNDRLPPGIRRRHTADGIVYQARVSNGRTGAEVARTFATKAEALEWKGAQERAKGTSRSVLAQAAGRGRTVAQQWEDWRARSRLESQTLRSYDSHYRLRIAPTLGPRRIKDLTSLELDLWVNRMVADGHGPTTIARTVSTLRALLKDAKAQGVIPTDVGKGMARLPDEDEPEHRPLEPFEVESLLKVSPEHYRPLWLTCALTGMRIGEALALRIADVHLATSTITVRQSQRQDGTRKLTKGRRSRTVGIPPQVAEALIPLLTGRSYSAPLFTRDNGDPLLYSYLLKTVWQPMIAAAGLADPQPTPHDLRHTTGTMLGGLGFSDRQIADLLGHASTATTQIYVHRTSETVHRAAQALGEMF